MDSSSGGMGGLAPQVVYRISVRVTGPRNTQSYYQSTFKL
jgi:type IV pilus assembly protein PilX